MSKASKKAVKPKMDISIDVVKAAIEDILERDQIPQQFLVSYAAATVMALLFEKNSLGENLNNMSYQMARIFQRFGLNPMDIQEQLATIYEYYKTQIENEIKSLVKKVENDGQPKQI